MWSYRIGIGVLVCMPAPHTRRHRRVIQTRFVETCSALKLRQPTEPVRHDSLCRFRLWGNHFEALRQPR